MPFSRNGRAGGTDYCPGVRCRIVPAAGVQGIESVRTAPDNHFTARPDCGVRVPRRGCIASVDGSPAICDGIILSASVQVLVAIVIKGPTPDDHFTAGPYSRVPSSTGGDVGSACGCPSICAGILPATVDQITFEAVVSTPDDHFAAGPHCRVQCSGFGRVVGGGGPPTVSAWVVSATGVRIP